MKINYVSLFVVNDERSNPYIEFNKVAKEFNLFLKAKIFKKLYDEKGVLIGSVLFTHKVKSERVNTSGKIISMIKGNIILNDTVREKNEISNALCYSKPVVEIVGRIVDNGVRDFDGFKLRKDWRIYRNEN